MSYTDDLLQSIDMIVSQRVQDVKFDKTIVGTIVEVKDDVYTVEYEAMKLVCYALNEAEYKVRDEVYVLIPQGDFNLRKVITGKVASKEVPVYLYVNPMLEAENWDKIGEAVILREFPEMPKAKYLAVTADFKCNSAEQKEYGLKIFYQKDDETEEKIWTFSSREFQGNPYKFLTFYQQSKLFDVSNFSKIKITKVEKYPSDLVWFYDHLVFSYGWAKEDIKQETQLLLSSPMESYPIDINKDIKFDNLRYIINKEFAELPKGHLVRWYQYNLTQQAEGYHETFWTLVQTIGGLSPCTEIISDKNSPSMRFKAKIFDAEGNSIIQSNILMLYREDEKEIQDKLKNATVTLTATNNGQYHYYNASTGLGDNIPSGLTVTASGIDWEDGMTIKWIVPPYITVVEENKKSIITKGVNPTLPFRIPSIYDSSIKNCLIECEVTNENGTTAKGAVKLDFGYKGSQGTECTFYITLDQDYLTPGKTITATAHFLNEKGEEENKAVSWSWQNGSPYLSSVDTDFITLESNKITCKASGDWSKYNGVLIAKLDEDYVLTSGKTVTYQAFKSIPLAMEEYYDIGGPSLIIYNSQGTNPQYVKTPYVCSDVTFLSNKTLKTFITVKEEENKKFLTVAELAPTTFPRVTIKIGNGESSGYPYLYVPMTIYRNQYSSDILNSWDGNYGVADGKIFSKMIGAGELNDSNQFTGVFMGSVGPKEESASTGLYGYKNGEMRFKLTDKGEGFLGTGSDNCVAFVDNKFTVSAKDFTFKSDDLLITSDPGEDKYVFKYKDKLLLDKDGNAYFKGNGIFNGEIQASTGKIANWNISSNKLIYPATASTNYGTGLTATVYKTDPAFYAGYQNGNKASPFEDANWRNYTNCYITNEGQFKCNNAVIDGNSSFTGTIKATSGEFTGTLKAGSIIGDTTSKSVQVVNTSAQITTLSIKYLSSSSETIYLDDIPGILMHYINNNITVLTFITPVAIFTASILGEMSVSESLVKTDGYYAPCQGFFRLRYYEAIPES